MSERWTLGVILLLVLSMGVARAEDPELSRLKQNVGLLTTTLKGLEKKVVAMEERVSDMQQRLAAVLPKGAAPLGGTPPGSSGSTTPGITEDYDKFEGTATVTVTGDVVTAPHKDDPDRKLKIRLGWILSQVVGKEPGHTLVLRAKGDGQARVWLDKVPCILLIDGSRVRLQGTGLEDAGMESVVLHLSSGVVRNIVKAKKVEMRVDTYDVTFPAGFLRMLSEGRARIAKLVGGK